MPASENDAPRTSSYPERHVLADGDEVLIRVVTKDDRLAIAKGFRQLSLQSRYFRFFTARSSLSERELDRLTNVDGAHHFALAVELIEPPVPIAIAHLFREADDPATAEMAITVADEQQGRGVGELLFRRLIAAALERGIEALECEVLAENRHMRHLVRKIDPDARSKTLRGVTSYRMLLEPSQTVVGRAADSSAH